MLELFYIPFQSVEASPQARSPFRTIQSGTIMLLLNCSVFYLDLRVCLGKKVHPGCLVLQISFLLPSSIKVRFQNKREGAGRRTIRYFGRDR